MKTIIISIGDELILGHTIDTNAAWLSEEFAALGLAVQQHITVADELDIIVQTLTSAAQTADIILITGGLGPTDDDLTRYALAKMLDVDLQLHQPSLDHIAEIFARKLIIALHRIAEPCSKIENTRLRIQSILKSNQQALALEQQKYDRETHHGAGAAAQERWFESIKQQLRQYAEVLKNMGLTDGDSDDSVDTGRQQ